MIRPVTFYAALTRKITMDVQLSKRQEQIVAEYVARVLESDRPQFYALLVEQLRGCRRVTDMRVDDAASYAAYRLRK